MGRGEGSARGIGRGRGRDAGNCIKRPSHSAPYKHHRVRTRKHFFGSKSKKTKRFLIFDPKKGGGHFFDIFDPHPTPPTPPTSLKTSKKWVSSGGG